MVLKPFLSYVHAHPWYMFAFEFFVYTAPETKDVSLLSVLHFQLLEQCLDIAGAQRIHAE